jgi:copper transport protein
VVRHRALWVVSLAAVAAAALPAAASAHAMLERTEPLRGVVTKQQPKRVAFYFSEPVETVFSAVRVFNAKGERADDNHVVHPGGRPSVVAVGLKPELADGSYTATYRVISADGHPVSGGFVFSNGKAGPPPRKTVADLTQGGGSTRPTSVSFTAARAFQYAAIALALGGLLFVFTAWFGGLREAAPVAGAEESSLAFARRARSLILLAVVAGIVSGLAGILLQGAAAAGVSTWSAARPSIVSNVLQTEFGSIWGIRILVWVLLGGLVRILFARESVPVLRPATLSAAGFALAPRFRNRGQLALLLLPVSFLAVSPALAGHAHTKSPTALLVPTNTAHVVAMSAWIGGLAMILFALPQATKRLEAADRGRLLAGVIVRFSTLAGIAVAILLVTGIVQSLFFVGLSLDNLLHTSYGQAVLVKIGLLVGLLAFGGLNRQVTVPRLRRLAAAGDAAGRTGLLLRRAVQAEIALAVVVLGATGVLTGLAPSTGVTKGPYSATTELGPAQLELTVDPARVGQNLVHLYLINARDGTQYDRAKEMTLAWTLPSKNIGPIEVVARRAGPGHYVVTDAALGLSGRWSLTVAARVSEFDAYYSRLKIPIR